MLFLATAGFLSLTWSPMSAAAVRYVIYCSLEGQLWITLPLAYKSSPEHLAVLWNMYRGARNCIRVPETPAVICRRVIFLSRDQNLNINGGREDTLAVLNLCARKCKKNPQSGHSMLKCCRSCPGCVKAASPHPPR